MTAWMHGMWGIFLRVSSCFFVAGNETVLVFRVSGGFAAGVKKVPEGRNFTCNL